MKWAYGVSTTTLKKRRERIINTGFGLVLDRSSAVSLFFLRRRPASASDPGVWDPPISIALQRLGSSDAGGVKWCVGGCSGAKKC